MGSPPLLLFLFPSSSSPPLLPPHLSLFLRSDALRKETRLFILALLVSPYFFFPKKEKDREKASSWQEKLVFYFNWARWHLSTYTYILLYYCKYIHWLQHVILLLDHTTSAAAHSNPGVSLNCARVFCQGKDTRCQRDTSQIGIKYCLFLTLTSFPTLILADFCPIWNQLQTL